MKSVFRPDSMAAAMVTAIDCPVLATGRGGILPPALSMAEAPEGKLPHPHLRRGSRQSTSSASGVCAAPG